MKRRRRLTTYYTTTATDWLELLCVIGIAIAFGTLAFIKATLN